MKIRADYLFGVLVIQLLSGCGSRDRMVANNQPARRMQFEIPSGFWIADDPEYQDATAVNITDGNLRIHIGLIDDRNGFSQTRANLARIAAMGTSATTPSVILEPEREVRFELSTGYAYIARSRNRSNRCVSAKYLLEVPGGHVFVYASSSSLTPFEERDFGSFLSSIRIGGGARRREVGKGSEGGEGSGAK